MDGRRILVVTADDFGLDPSINAGVVTAHRHGLVGCASLVASGRGFMDAVDRCRDNPQLQVAIHLTLVEEVPAAPIERVRSLVDHGGRFPLDYRRFLARYLARRIRRQDLVAELTAQIEKILEAGIQPFYLNSHQHLHMLPSLWEIVLDLATEYEISNIRRSLYQVVWDGHPGAGLSRLGLNALSRRAVRRAADWHRLVPTVGLHTAGHLTKRKLGALLAGLPPGTWELVTHPGHATAELSTRYPHGYNWSREVEVLCSVGPKEVAEYGIVLGRL